MSCDVTRGRVVRVWPLPLTQAQTRQGALRSSGVVQQNSRTGSTDINCCMRRRCCGHVTQWIGKAMNQIAGFANVFQREKGPRTAGESFVDLPKTHKVRFKSDRTSRTRVEVASSSAHLLGSKLRNRSCMGDAKVADP